MTLEKTKNGWHQPDEGVAKAWYKIKITPHDEEKESYVFKVETRNIEWTMEQYARNREPFDWEMSNWNIRV